MECKIVRIIKAPAKLNITYGSIGVIDQSWIRIKHEWVKMNGRGWVFEDVIFKHPATLPALNEHRIYNKFATKKPSLDD